MKTRIVIIVKVLILSFLACNAQNKNKEIDFSNLSGTYLDQKPPGTKPVLFADGLIANKYPSFHTNIIFTPDGKECYWKARLPNNVQVIVFSKLENNKWSSPAIAPFSKAEFRDDAPFISPDGKRLYFLSKRPIILGEEVGKENIWLMYRNDKDWSKPEPLPSCINSLQGIHWQLSVDRDYNLFFGTCTDLYSPGRLGDIYCSKYVNGQYQPVNKLDNKINSKQDYNSSPFISPDGTYLIFSRENSINHKIQIFISYLKEDQTWSEAKDLISIIGDEPQTCPIITSDGKYFFFLRYVNSFCQPFWVDAGFIDELRPKN